jgi:anti-anti-sigma factor
MASHAPPPGPDDTRPRLGLERHGNLLHVRFPRGRADGIAVREIYETAAQMVDQPHAKMLVDLEGLEMASSGLMGILVQVKKKFLNHGGQLHVAVPDPMIRQSFHVMNLHLVLSLFTSAQEARAAFKG